MVSSVQGFYNPESDTEQEVHSTTIGGTFVIRGQVRLTNWSTFNPDI
jgi:hypothetical protein